jgi:hypothetical protein
MSPQASKSQLELLGHIPGRVGPGGGQPTPLSGGCHSNFAGKLPRHREGIFYTGNGGRMEDQATWPRERSAGHPHVPLGTPFSQ